MIQSISRAASILNLFKTHRYLSLTEISKLIGLPKTTTYGLVDALKREGFMDQDPVTKNYYLGLSIFELGSRYRTRLNLREIAMPVMQELADTVRETIQLAILHGRHVVYLARIATANFLTFAIADGVRVPAHCTSTGKAILAYLSEERIDELFRDVELERATPYSIQTLEDLKRQLQITRQNGYSMDIQEIEIGLGGISIPVFGQRHEVKGSLCISIPVERCTPEYINEYLPHLQNGAKIISTKLGCIG